MTIAVLAACVAAAAMASATIVNSVVVEKASQTRCGTASVDLTPLTGANYSYVYRDGSLPPTFFFSICESLNSSFPNSFECSDSVACLSGPFRRFSLGQFSTVNYTDVPGGVMISAAGPLQPGMPQNQMTMQILCAPTSTPSPWYTGGNSTATVNLWWFLWTRTEVCPTPPPTPSPPPCQGQACLSKINNCIAAAGKPGTCDCFRTAMCFGGCAWNDTFVEQAQAECMKANCGLACVL